MAVSSRNRPVVNWPSKGFVLIAILFTFCTLSSGATYRFQNSGGFQKPAASPKENPYRVLGLRSSSMITEAEIKQAYRSLAKTHHPDKGGDPDQFARIANAYELLMDPVRRRQYDHLQQNKRNSNKNRRPSSSPSAFFNFKSSSTTSQQNHRRQQQRQKQEQNNQQQQEAQRQKSPQFVKLVRDMQKRVLRVTELNELFDSGIIRNEEYSSSKAAKPAIFAKHFLGVFVGNKKQEQLADGDLLFPYPFGTLEGEAGPNFWSEVVTTAKIRYNKPTELTRLFKVPGTSSKKNDHLPHIVFGRAGTTKVEVFEPSAPPPVAKNKQESWRLKTQKELQLWLKKLMTFDLQITNSHFSNIKIFKVPQTFEDQSPTNSVPVLMKILGPGKTTALRVTTSDRLMVIDSRVDTYPGAVLNTLLMKGFGDKEMAGLNDAPQRRGRAYSSNPAVMLEYMVGLEKSLEISEGQCYDLSLSCQSWALTDKQCPKVPEFMHNMCKASCGLCRWDGDRRNMNSYEKKSNQPNKNLNFSSWLLQPGKWKYTIKHAPIHQLPKYVRGPIQFLRFFEEDLKHVLQFRRNTVATFFLLGAILGINFFVFPNWLQGGGLAAGPDGRGYPRLSWSDLSAVALLFITVGFWCWLFKFSSPSSVTLRREFDMFHGFINLPVIGAFCGILVTFDLLYLAGVRRMLIVGFALAAGIAYMQKDAYSQIIIIGYIYETSPILALLVILSPTVIAFAVIPFLKLSWRSRDLLVLLILDLGVGLAIRTFSISDKFFWKDMNHVLKVRMSAAIPFGLAGIFFGFGIPFGLVEYAHRARIPPKRKA